jgi:hypothetical protein
LVAAQHRSLLYTTRVNQAEILSAIGALPEGRRRQPQIASRRIMFRYNVAGVACFSLRRVRSNRRHTNSEMAE